MSSSSAAATPAARRRPRRRASARATALVTQRATHRRHVVQPGDRRARQRPSGARDRRARRTDGRAPPTPPASSSASSTARKGPAVQGPRAQADRKLYRRAMQAADRGDRQSDRRSKARRPTASSTDGARRPALALADGRALACGALVLTTGTFLRGMIHLGEQRTPAGRVGDPPSVALARTLDARRLRARAAQDRHAAAARRRVRSTGRRLEMQPGDDRARAVLGADRGDHDRRRSPAASPARPPEAHAIVRANAASLAGLFRRDLRPRAALLPLDRGQGHPLRRPRQPSDLSGAGGPRRSDRSIPTASRRRCRRRCRRAFLAHHSRARARAHPAARLRHRIRLHRSARA